MNKAEYEASRRIKAGGRPEITEESPYFKVPKVVPRPPMPTSNPLDAAAHGEPAQKRERPNPDRSSSSGSASVPKVVPRPPMTSTPLDAAPAVHGEEPAQERERPDPDRSSSGSGSASVGVSTAAGRPPAMRLSFNTSPTGREASMENIKDLMDAYNIETEKERDLVDKVKKAIQAKADQMIRDITNKHEIQAQRRHDQLIALVDETEKTEGEAGDLEKELSQFTQGIEMFYKDIKEDV